MIGIVTWNSAWIKRQFGLSQRQYSYWMQVYQIDALVPPDGAGSTIRFDIDGVITFSQIKVLTDAGFTRKQIKKILET